MRYSHTHFFLGSRGGGGLARHARRATPFKPPPGTIVLAGNTWGGGASIKLTARSVIARGTKSGACAPPPPNRSPLAASFYSCEKWVLHFCHAKAAKCLCDARARARPGGRARTHAPPPPACVYVRMIGFRSRFLAQICTQRSRVSLCRWRGGGGNC